MGCLLNSVEYLILNHSVIGRKVKIWLEAMRLRTLPVSLSGVVIAVALAMSQGKVRWVPAVLCLVFALLAQVTSNFANEYYDYLGGIDKKGREGFRRGVTEGDIKPATLKLVTYLTLAAACLVGLCTLPYGDWRWLLPSGVVIALGALAYSTGPYPLSHHGLGELAVFLFYGVLPVNLTYYLASGNFTALALITSIATGLMGVNVLLVNNIRDVDDDREAGKLTSVVIFGLPPARLAYLLNGFAAMSFLAPIWLYFAIDLFFVPGTSDWSAIKLLPPFIYLAMHFTTTAKLYRSSGAALNPLLGQTARNMLIFTVLLAIALNI